MLEQATCQSLLLTQALLGDQEGAEKDQPQQVLSASPVEQGAVTSTGAVSDMETQFRSFAVQKQAEAVRYAKAVFGNKHVKTELWSRLDLNGNGIVSCAEIDKLVTDLSTTDLYSGFFTKLNHKPAIMRAYQWTTKREATSDGDEWVERKEFNALLKNLFFFNELWNVFESADTGHDRRIDVHEFQEGLANYGMEVSATTAQELFARFDADHGGQILFSGKKNTREWGLRRADAVLVYFPHFLSRILRALPFIDGDGRPSAKREASGDNEITQSTP